MSKKIRVIEIGLLQVARSYQRAQKPKLIKKIIDQYDEDALQPVTVGHRQDDSYWVVDGQNRLEALTRLGHKKIRCDVFQSRGKSHEARVWRLCNTNTNMALPDKIRALIDEEEPNACEMQAIIERNGFAISYRPSAKWPKISALAAVYQAHQDECLDMLLGLLKTWPDNTQALNNTFLRGLALMAKKYGAVLDTERFSRVLGVNDPVAIIGAGDARKLSSGSRFRAVMDVMVDIYNRGLSVKLEDKLNATE